MPGDREMRRVCMLAVIRIDETEEASCNQEGGGAELLITERNVSLNQGATKAGPRVGPA
jgi:hypothetical protein